MSPSADHSGPRLGVQGQPDPHVGPDAPPAPAPGSRGAVVDWALYVGGERRTVSTYAEAVRLARQGGGFVWIGLHEPTHRELAGIAVEFGLHPLAVEDAVHAHQRPKLEQYDDTYFTVFKTVRYVPHESVTEASQIVETGEVMVFLGADFVVTVRHGEHGGLHGVRERLEAQPSLLAHGPSAVLYALADTIVDTYLDVAAHVEDDIDAIEARAFSGDRERGDIGRIYQVKRELLELRRSVTPLVGPLRQLAAQPLVEGDDEIREYFRDVEDHLTRAREMIAAYDELLTSIIQASLAQLSMSENEDMRKITAWAAIIAVPTAITGVYGMNFRYMPWLDDRWGYPALLGIIAVVCLVLYRQFKRIGWL